MKISEFSVPLVIPGSFEHDWDRIAESFRAEGVDVSQSGVFVTKALGPPPDANFWIDLTRHAESFPIEHFIDQLEGALGLAILSSFRGITLWAAKKLRIHLRLPSKNHGVQYIVPDEPEDKAAITAIAKHWKAVREYPAREYFWVHGKWVSKDEHFRK